MNILVWKGYGEIDVYSAETSKDVENILDVVVSIFRHWGSDEAIELNNLIEKVKKFSNERNESDADLAKRLRFNLFRFLENRNLTDAYDVEDFEYFHFQEVKKIG